MILAFDTYYTGTNAKTVCLAFQKWTDDKPFHVFEETMEGIADYEPGAFYKRELPCILSLLSVISISDIEVIIVDGYVILDDDGKTGLGGLLFDKLERRIPVIGVAKSGFHNNKKNVLELFRGKSKKPLYITAKGMGLTLAYNRIKSMHGNYRMPSLLRILDTKTKENSE